jgi:hypothetical protein
MGEPHDRPGSSALPRLQKVPTSHRDVMDDTVRLLRIGHVASQLHATLRSFDPDLGLRLKLLLADVHALPSKQ